MEEARTGLIRSTVGRGENTQVNIKEGSATRWEVTGIIGLSASHLKVNKLIVVCVISRLDENVL